MKSIDKAIREYTDSIMNNTPLLIESFSHEMSYDDFLQFADLARLIDLLFSANQQEKDKTLFMELNNFKISIYNQSKTVNFRTEKGDAPQKAIDDLQRLFDEEFPDE